MPYRRLPNTDQARVRALKSAVERSINEPTYNSVISPDVLNNARVFLRKLESAHAYYRQCYDNQSKESHKHQTNIKTARIYLSHFIQVLNLSIIRSEIKKSSKVFYELPLDNYSVPDLTSETAIIEWGAKIIAGEKARLENGGIPIYNPTIAKVKVHYDIFVDSHKMQKNLQMITARSLAALTSMRTEADELIVNIWDQVEECFNDVTPLESRLDRCRDYGVIYYYRSGEKKPE